MPPDTRNRTRWRDGPTGMIRNDSVSDDHSPSGRSHGSSTRSMAGSRRRSRGNASILVRSARSGCEVGNGAVVAAEVSEPLPEVRGNRPVIAQLLVEPPRVRPMMTGGHLGKGRADLATEPLRLG